MQRHVTRRRFLETTTAGLGALALSGPLWATDAGKRPNVLIITTDQQRVDAMSALGNKWVRTPHMDSLVANGVYFTNSYCPYPLCSPARAALHAGRTPHEIGVDRNNMSIDPSIPISAQVFREAGYETAYAGKWHCPEAYPSRGIPGFEVLNKTTRPGKLAQAVDEATMTAAIDFLKRKHEKPFLLVASFINPHDICLPAGEDSKLLPDLWNRYQPPAGAAMPPLPANFAPTAGEPEVLSRRSRHPDWDEAQWRKFAWAYYRMMEDVDRQIGQIMDTLRQIGQEENTIVIFTSDHGEGLGSHRWTRKMMFYEEEAAVPLIISWKGVTPAARIDREHLVSSLDVLPTLCDYCGVKPPPLIRGVSLRPILEKPQQAGHEFVVSEMVTNGGRASMLRTKKYKYIVFPDSAEMFFDMDADPGEMKNLAADSSLADQLQRHRKLLAEWHKFTELDKNPIRPNPKPGQKKARKNA